ncbi:hypothetical protein [Streptomyces sp. B21-101]|uniref:hypothetical protein n=1 Tax=Streptomyces sp. B21-101 TaxID=3039415 RepID=UPI002FF3C60C
MTVVYFDEVRLPLLQMYQRGVHFHNGKGHARPDMTPTLEAVAAGRLHPELVTSGIHGWDEIPDEPTSGRAGHKPVFVLESEEAGDRRRPEETGGTMHRTRGSVELARDRHGGPPRGCHATAFSKSASTSGRSRAMKWPAFGT